MTMDARASTTVTAVICLAAAAISCAFTGFVFGISNNQYHLPIIERLYDEPQFAADAFVQSLRYFASGVWMILSWSPKFADGGYGLFLALFFLSRLLSFIGLVCCASLLGIETVKERVVFCAIVCFTTFLDGNSYAGHGGLFLMTFTHSEIANGTFLLSISFAIRGRISPALAFAGSTFFINAFMAVWLMLPLLLIGIALVRDCKTILPSLLRDGIWGAACFAIFAAPVLYNIFSNPEFGTPIDFNYVAFLKEYYGAHFLIGSNSAIDILLLIELSLVGWLALRMLRGSAAEFRLAFAGLLVLYAIGIVLPSLTSIPVILNLHLLRTSAVISLLAALGAGALATQWICSSDRRQSLVLGPCLAFCLCASLHQFPAAVVILGFSFLRLPQHPSPWLRSGLAVLFVCAVLPWQTWQHIKLNSALTESVNDWRSVGAWAKSATPPDSVFLIATANDGTLQKMSQTDAQRAFELTDAASVFDAAAHRRVWVDFKRGGAVMLTPSYYRTWHQRITAVLGLTTLSQKIAYARSNGIQYIVDDCRLFSDTTVTPAYRGSRLCAVAATPET